MARNRANTEPGQTAIVGDLRFRPGQLLPQGTVEYQVNGWYELAPEDQVAGGPKGIPYSITVPVGTSRAKIQDAVQMVASMTLADAYADMWATDQELGLNIFDLLDDPHEPI